MSRVKVTWSLLVAAVVLLPVGAGLDAYYANLVSSHANSPPRPYTLPALTCGDVANMTKILDQARARTGVRVQLTSTDPLSAAQEIADGTAQRRYDAVWCASDAYFDLFPPAAKDLKGTTPIMSSPVVLAVRSSVAQRLGWGRGSATWAQIVRAAASGDFTFGMASPATSDAGLSGLIAAAIATASSNGALGESQAAAATPELSSLFHGQTLSAPDSSQLIEDYLTELKDPEPGLPAGLIGYESDLITLKAEAPRSDPLTLVYPSDGATVADYPLSVLTTAPPAARAAFALLAGYLTSPAVQQQIVTMTHHRPAIRLKHLNSELPAIPKVLSPGSPAVVSTLLGVYLSHLRTPGRTIYVLDTSASMAVDGGLAELKRALDALTEAGSGLAGKLGEFRAGDEITFLPFNYAPPTPAPPPFIIPSSDPGPVLTQIRGSVNSLRAHGRTAIYDALEDAYQILAHQDASAPGRIDSIVLITDGGNDWGRSLGDFLGYYRSRSTHGKPASVYPIAVGEADLIDLQQVASATGGVLVDAKQEPLSALDAIIATIRGYQWPMATASR